MPLATRSITTVMTNLPLIQIERPGEDDGSVVAWRDDIQELAEEVSNKMGLRMVSPQEIKEHLFTEDPCQKYPSSICRKIVGVAPDENIFVNGIVIGKSTSSEVAIVAENGLITQLIGGELKEHGLEKLGMLDSEKAIVKTGLLRKSKVNLGYWNTKKLNSKYTVSYLNHAADDIYRLKNVDMVVTVGDDTTLVAADILYRFNIPIIGITDGDLDKVVEQGFKADGSLIVELERGWDDLVGEKIFLEVFNGQETIEIENLENFKTKLLQIINNTAICHQVKYN